MHKIALVFALAACIMRAQLPDTLMLKDYKPQSIFKIPETHPLKAKYPAIDMHYHIVQGASGIRAPGTVEQRSKVMDETGIVKSVILTQATPYSGQ